jgi:hypothetical protein
MSAADIVGRLGGVLERGPGKWIARCPAHEDKHPSLSIRECDDGTILLHDFAGCHPLDICRAMGIEFADLFPARRIRRVDPGIRRCALSASERLQLLEHEIGEALFIANDFLRDGTISKENTLRLAQCVGRIGSARHA